MATTLGTAEGPAAEPVWPGVGMCRGEGFCKEEEPPSKGSSSAGGFLLRPSWPLPEHREGLSVKQLHCNGFISGWWLAGVFNVKLNLH